MNTLESCWQHLRDHFVPNAGNNYHPHALKHRTLHLYAGLLISVKIATLFSLDLLPENKAISSAITTENIIALTNASRASLNIRPLRQDQLLGSAAQAKADDMIKNQYFAHNSPSGKSPWDFISTFGYNYMIAGENLAINFTNSESIEEAWMNSPGHKANIVNKDFEDIGIGIAQGSMNGVNAIVVVQMFGSRIDQPIKPLNIFSAAVPLPDSRQEKALRQKISKNRPIPIPELPVELPKASTGLPRAAAEITDKLTQTALPAPTLTAPEFYLTNDSDLTISGTAPKASYIYVFINGELRSLIQVANGEFSDDISLDEGLNSIYAVSVDGKNEISAPSNQLEFKLDSRPPEIFEALISPRGEGGVRYVEVKVKASGDAVKIIADIAGNATMLQPTSESNLWRGVIDSNLLSPAPLVIKAYDLAGNSSYKTAGNVSGSFSDNYGFSAKKQNYYVSILGNKFKEDSVKNFYLYFVLFLLVAMVLSIGIRRNIQHIQVLAHASAMVVLAVFFWLI